MFACLSGGIKCVQALPKSCHLGLSFLQSVLCLESTVPLLGVCLLVQMCTRNLPYLSTNMSLWITSTTNGNDCIDRIIFSFNNKHAKFTLGPNAEHWDTVVTLKDLRMYLGEARKKS